MKQTKTTAAILSAIALALAAPPAFAEVQTGKVVGGIALTGLGGFLLSSAIDDRDKNVNARAQSSGVASGSAFSEAPAKTIGGGLGIIGGVYLIVNGLTGGSDNFTQNGFVMDGVTFGYTDGDKLGLQKKWEF